MGVEESKIGGICVCVHCFYNCIPLYRSGTMGKVQERALTGRVRMPPISLDDATGKKRNPAHHVETWNIRILSLESRELVWQRASHQSDMYLVEFTVHVWLCAVRWRGFRELASDPHDKTSRLDSKLNVAGVSETQALHVRVGLHRKSSSNGSQAVGPLLRVQDILYARYSPSIGKLLCKTYTSCLEYGKNMIKNRITQCFSCD